MKLEDLPPHVQAKARKLLAAQQAPAAPEPPRTAPRAIPAGRRAHGSVAWREGDTLWLSLAVAPRTKKNSRRTLVAPSVAYARQIARAALAPAPGEATTGEVGRA